MFNALPTTYTPSDSLNKKKFQNFRSIFGTHFVEAVTWGGKVSLKTQMSVCTTATCKALLVEAEVEANVNMGYKGASGGTSQSVETQKCRDTGGQSLTSSLDRNGGSASSAKRIPAT